MPKITETMRIAKQPDALWRKIGRFDAVGDWHPMLAKVESEGEQEGSIRTAEGRDGSRQIERLLEVSPEQRFYRYKIESTTMPVRDYIGDFRVQENDAKTSTVAWSCEFKVESDDKAGVIEMIRKFLRAGLENLKILEGGAST